MVGGRANALKFYSENTNDLPDKLGPNTAEGAEWLKEAVKAKEPSEPFLFSGWPKRCAWIRNDGNEAVDFVFEVDKMGDGKWELQQSVLLEAESTEFIEFATDDPGEWIRMITDLATIATVQFSPSFAPSLLQSYIVNQIPLFDT